MFRYFSSFDSVLPYRMKQEISLPTSIVWRSLVHLSSHTPIYIIYIRYWISFYRWFPHACPMGPWLCPSRPTRISHQVMVCYSCSSLSFFPLHPPFFRLSLYQPTSLPWLQYISWTNLLDGSLCRIRSHTWSKWVNGGGKGRKGSLQAESIIRKVCEINKTTLPSDLGIVSDLKNERKWKTDRFRLSMQKWPNGRRNTRQSNSLCHFIHRRNSSREASHYSSSG